MYLEVGRICHAHLGHLDRVDDDAVDLGGLRVVLRSLPCMHHSIPKTLGGLQVTGGVAVAKLEWFGINAESDEVSWTSLAYSPQKLHPALHWLAS